MNFLITCLIAVTLISTTKAEADLLNLRDVGENVRNTSISGGGADGEQPNISQSSVGGGEKNEALSKNRLLGEGWNNPERTANIIKDYFPKGDSLYTGLLPPSKGPVFPFSNDMETPSSSMDDMPENQWDSYTWTDPITKDSWQDSVGSSESDDDDKEEMETASTFIIGPHSGRFIRPAATVWFPPFNPYRYNRYNYRPYSSSYIRPGHGHRPGHSHHGRSGHSHGRSVHSPGIRVGHRG